jgi:transposase
VIPTAAGCLIEPCRTPELDLSAILAAYTEPRGYPPYHPAMMVALLLYAYSRGVYSSRRIARACEERLDFQAVTALNRPDFRTISEFRRRHLAALAELFVQVLALCRRAGLVRLGHVAVDGTKLRANASKHKAMSYGRMGRTRRRGRGLAGAGRECRCCGGRRPWCRPARRRDAGLDA